MVLGAALAKPSSAAGRGQFVLPGPELLTLFIPFDGNVRFFCALPSTCSAAWPQEIVEFTVFETRALDCWAPFLSARWPLGAVPPNWVR